MASGRSATPPEFLKIARIRVLPGFLLPLFESIP
jgi:hypothetical protein